MTPPEFSIVQNLVLSSSPGRTGLVKRAKTLFIRSGLPEARPFTAPLTAIAIVHMPVVDYSGKSRLSRNILIEMDRVVIARRFRVAMCLVVVDFRCLLIDHIARAGLQRGRRLRTSPAFLAPYEQNASDLDSHVSILINEISSECQRFTGLLLFDRLNPNSTATSLTVRP